MIFCEIAQRHFLHIVTDLRHLLLHHLDVEDELDELLDSGRQFALLELLLRIDLALTCFIILFILFFVGLVVQFDLLVISPTALLVVLTVKLSNGTGNRMWASSTLLPLDTDSAPPSKEIAGIRIAVLLDYLQDVEFVVIVSHFGLVESGAVYLTAVF